MREVKFRAWDRIEKQILEVRELTFLFDEGSPLCIQAWEPDTTDKNTAYLITRAPGDFVLMQFTGLKDRNGKEIYEGDVVRCRLIRGDNHTYDYPVTFEDATFKARNRLSVYDECEVIGNIYENPDLDSNEKARH